MKTMAANPVTRLLDRLTLSGVEVGALDEACAGELLPLLYDELHRLAERAMADEPVGHTLQPTALVHEAWLRLVGADAGWQSRAHFFGAAARAMRRVLVDHARGKARLKRGAGAARVELDQALLAGGEPDLDLVALDEALDRLEAHDARKSRVVHLRSFAGLTLEEIARALDVSLATVKADWAYARAWLLRELRRGCAAAEGPR
jgi:RNA polymerase sigma factor (TIGR02999 family)